MKLMENTWDTFFPLSGQMEPMGHNRHIIGVTISFFIHVSVFCSIYFLGPSLSDFKPPLVIDFSIEQSSRKAQPQEVATEAENEPVPPPPVKKEVVLPQASVPENTEIVQVPKVEPLVTKREVVERVVEEVKPPEDIVIEEVAAAEDIEVEELDKTQSAKVSTKSKPKQALESFSFTKEKYLKEHFDYIKNNVQNKISYPRIARKMGWQGRVLISFIICMDGSVKDIRVIESSGHNALDKNALEVVRKVAPFPKPPVSAELIIPVVYKLS